MPHVITLVHGTFAQQARWTRSDSSLCKALANSLGNDVVFSPFSWSGKNNARSRYDAALALRQHLRLQLLHFPECKHFVIAHSHGGNVALAAVSGTELETSVAGIACLATPFIHITPRLSNTVEFEFVKSAITTIAATITFALVIFVLSHTFRMHSVRMAWIVALACLVPLWFVAKDAEKWPTRLEAKSKRILGLWHITVPSDLNLFIIRAAQDEASGALATAQFSAWLFRQAFRILLSPHLAVKASRWGVRTATVFGSLRHRILYWVGPIFIFYCVFTLKPQILTPGAVSTWILFLIVFAPIAWLMLVIAGLGVIAVLRIPSFALTMPLWIAATICLLPFGLDLALGVFWFQITVEATPSGSWDVVLLDPESNLSEAVLRHGKIYDDARCWQHLVEWISASSRLAVNPRSLPCQF